MFVVFVCACVWCVCGVCVVCVWCVWCGVWCVVCVCLRERESVSRVNDFDESSSRQNMIRIRVILVKSPKLYTCYWAKRCGACRVNSV